MTRFHICCCALAAQLTLSGQTPLEEQLKAKHAAEQLQQEKRAAEAMHILNSGLSGTGKVVRDKPFSAEAVTETVQELVDGNRIVRHNLTKQYRDRAGRTRREQTIESLGPSNPVTPKQIVFISDPLAKADFILDPIARTVRKLNRPESLIGGTAAGTSAESGDVRREALGKRTLEGLECTGTRTTFTVPAGRIGNERPLVTVTETWYSPAIEAVVQSTTSDPRFGETRYYLREVQRSDQLPQLFEVPPDYRSNQ